MNNPLNDLLKTDKPNPKAIAALLDSMTHTDRVTATRSLERQAMAKLYDVVQGFKTLTTNDMVPQNLSPLKPITHVGTNNLAALRSFLKPMYRLSNGEYAGRNVQSMEWITGPGYFVLENGNTTGELLLNYERIPHETPPGWPKPKSNARGFSYFVFRDLHDAIRRVSEHVIIGKASRHGKDLPQYFTLVRDESLLKS